jgi:hypothetical protein
MRAIAWLVVVGVVSVMGCAQAPPTLDKPLPAVCGNSKAVDCFAREAQGRVDHCFSAMTKNLNDQQSVIDACGGFTDEDIEELYNRAREESKWVRGVTTDLQRYYERWQRTWTALQRHYLYGLSPQTILGEVTALRGQSLELIR